MCSLVAAGVLAAAFGLCAYSLQVPVYARRLSHHADVLRQA
jgi:hypothetical protein